MYEESYKLACTLSKLNMGWNLEVLDRGLNNERMG